METEIKNVVRQCGQRQSLDTWDRDCGQKANKDSG